MHLTFSFKEYRGKSLKAFFQSSFDLELLAFPNPPGLWSINEGNSVNETSSSLEEDSFSKSLIELILKVFDAFRAEAFVTRGSCKSSQKLSSALIALFICDNIKGNLLVVVSK